MSNKFLQVSDFYKRLTYKNKLKSIFVSNSIKKDCSLPKSVGFLCSKRTHKGFISIKNRCVLTGRSRAVFKKLKISRMPLKYLSVHGFLPGISKFSW